MLNPVPKGRGAIINLGVPFRPIRVAGASPFVHRGGYGILPCVGQD